MPPTIPLDKVQGIILRGYERLEEATFVLLKINDVSDAKHWLADLLDKKQIMDATKKPAEKTTDTPDPAVTAVNVAFTWAGLIRLLGDKAAEAAQGFSLEFTEGMDNERRQRILGDAGASAPDQWAWGSGANKPDILLMLYATNPATLAGLVAEQTAAFTSRGLSTIATLETKDLVGRKEQFGFRDGIAQPFIEGVYKDPPNTERESQVEGNILKAGEILLGYDNEYEKSPVRPRLAGAAADECLDFGSNGSYLVFRQLEQKVHAFWKFLYEATNRQELPKNPAADQVQLAVKLAAKMVGRWPSGAPLMKASVTDDPKLLDEDSYGYAKKDPLGDKCPIGSHTRRSNPRDSLEPGPNAGRLTREDSLRVTKRHRIVRRGRPYGEPIHKSMEPNDIITTIANREGDPADKDRGLHFLCFNADIARQFEFIQQTWINNPKFGGMYGDNDPIMGERFLPQVIPSFKITKESLASLTKAGLPAPLMALLTPLLDQEFPDQDELVAELGGEEIAAAFSPEELAKWQTVVLHHTRVSASDTFTWQDEPVRHRFTKLPDFVRVVGGGYFFMPGLDAVRYLAGQANALPIVKVNEVKTDVTKKGLKLATEYPPPGEADEIQRLTYLLLNKVRKDYPVGKGITRRDAHAKHHGCVKAEFIIEPNLPDELRVGVFRAPRTFQAWVRFSNQFGVAKPDRDKDIRGMAVKLMGVEGDKILEGEKDAKTQDFILISHPVFVSKTVVEFRRLVQAMTGGVLSLGWFFLNPFDLHIRSAWNLYRSLRRHANVLKIQYWSVAPYLFGTRAVKYSARPQITGISTVPAKPDANYLQQALVQSLNGKEVLFDFLVQVQTDPVRMPIEDPGARWSEAESPFRKVATIKLLSLQCDLSDPKSVQEALHMEFGENISFTPWHSLPEHRPLGGINRARKVAYRIISEFRHLMNATPRQEPSVD